MPTTLLQQHRGKVQTLPLELCSQSIWFNTSQNESNSSGWITFMVNNSTPDISHRLLTCGLWTSQLLRSLNLNYLCLYAIWTILRRNYFEQTLIYARIKAHHKQLLVSDLLWVQLLLSEVIPRRYLFGGGQYRLNSATDGRLCFFEARLSDDARYCQLDVDDQ